MTITQLKGLLRSTFTNNRIVQLPNDLSAVPELQKIWNEHLGNTVIPFTATADDLDNLFLFGTASYWNTDINLSLQFYSRSGKIDFKMEMIFPNDWTLQDSWPLFTNNPAAPLLSEAKLIFISAPQVPGLEELDNFDRDPHLYFSAQQKVEGTLLPIKWLLGEAPTLQLIGPVTIEQELPDMELVAHISDTIKLDFFNNLPVAFVWNSEVMESPDQPNSFQNQVYYEVQAFIPFQGKDIILKANFQNDPGLLNFQAALTDISLNSLTQLGPLCHDTNLAAILPDNLNLGNHIGLSEINLSISPTKKTIASIGFTLSSTEDWEIMDGFSFSDIGLTIEVEQPGKKTLRKTNASITGNMNLGATAQLVLAANYPEKNLTAALAENNSLPISELTTRIFPIGELPNVQLSQLNLDFAPTKKEIKAATQLELGWGINFGSNAILLQNVHLDLLKNETEKEVSLSATSNLLGLEFNLTGAYQGADAGWTFTGISQTDTELSISTLVESVIDFFGVTVPLYNPDIKIGEIEIILNTKTKRFHLTAKSSIKTALHIANKRVLVDTAVAIQSSLDQATKKRSLVGHINASVELVAGFLFQLQFTMNDAQPVTYGSWKMTNGNSLSLDDLLVALGIDKATFDPASQAVVDIIRQNVLDNLALTGLSFSFQGPKKQLSLKADTALFGSLVLSAHKSVTTNKWEQIIGLEFPPNTKLSDIPGLKDELSATDFMSFQNVAFLISTNELNGANLQKITIPGEDETDTETFLEGTSLYLSRGLNVAAKIDLQNADDASLKNLQGATDLDSLTIQAALGKSELNFRSSLGGEIGFSVGDDQLDFKDPYVQLDVLPKFGLQLGGSLMVDFNSVMLKAEGGLVITPMEVSGRLMVSAHDPDAVDTSAENATGNLLEPLGIKGIKLNSIGFIVGATFFPPGIKFGMQAGFQIGDQAPSVNKLATIFQVIPAVPSPVVNMQLLSFQLQEMDVNTMLTVFTNDNAPELPSFINEIRATDLGFFYCSTITTLPDGNTALPGFGFHGNVNLFGFKTRAALQINPISGISGAFQMTPIEIKVGDLTILSVKGKGEAISNYFIENENGEWEKVNAEEALLPKAPEDLENSGVITLPNIKEEVIMDAGGPIFEFNTNGPRYLFASVQASLFDFISMEIEAEISNTGMSFLYNYQVSDILEIEFDLGVNWTGDNPGFNGHASFELDLDFEVPLPFGLPSIDLDAGLHASATLKVDQSEFLFKIDGGFHFEGIDFTLPTIEIKIAFGSLKDIAQKIIDHILENAAEIFKEIFAFLEEAWNDFKDGVEFLYNETKELVENIGKEAVAIAEDALEFAEAAVEKVEEVLDDIGEEIVQAYETGKKFVEDTAEAIVEIGKAAAEAFDDFVEEAAAVFEAAGEFAEQVYEEARQFVENVGKEIAHIASEAVKAVKKFAQDAAREAKKILDAAIRVAKQIWDGIKSTVAALLNAAKHLEQLAVAIWREIDEFLAAAAKAIEDAANDVVDWVSDAGSAIGNTLEEAC